MTDVFNEQLPHNEGFIISEANGTLSREEVTIAAGSQLEAGTIMAIRDDSKWDQHDPDSSEGNTSAAGILCSRVAASTSDRTGVVIRRLAEVRDDDLVWIDGISTANQTTAETALATLNIIIRNVATSVSTQST